MARKIFENLAGEKSLHIFEGLGHVIAVNGRRAQWEERVRKFLAEAGIVLPKEESGGGDDGEEEEEDYEGPLGDAGDPFSAEPDAGEDTG